VLFFFIPVACPSKPDPLVSAVAESPSGPAPPVFLSGSPNYSEIKLSATFPPLVSRSRRTCRMPVGCLCPQSRILIVYFEGSLRSRGDLAALRSAKTPFRQAAGPRSSRPRPRAPRARSPLELVFFATLLPITPSPRSVCRIHTALQKDDLARTPSPEKRGG